jgi:hypothetical protein
MERHRTIRDVDVFGWRSIGDRAQSEASKDEEEPRSLHWRQEECRAAILSWSGRGRSVGQKARRVSPPRPNDYVAAGPPPPSRRPVTEADLLNRTDRSAPMPGEADVKYLDGDFRVVRPGAFVRCAVTGAAIPLEELRYWSVDLQEAYASPEAVQQRRGSR